MLRAEKIFVVPWLRIKDIFLAVEEDEIHAHLGFEILHLVGQFHQESNAGAAVVGAQERLVPFTAVGFLIGDRPGVVMRANNDPALAVGMPTHDQVGHVHRPRLTLLPNGEVLHLDLAAQGFKMFLEQPLLLLHPIGAANARADLADVFEIPHGPGAIKNHIVPVGGELVSRRLASGFS